MADQKHISTLEWLIVLSIAVVLDLVELLTDLFTAGIMEAIWPFTDMIIWAIFMAYLWLRGQKFSDPKRLAGNLATFGIKIVPLLEDLPLWTLDVLWQWSMAEGKAVVNKVAGTQTAKKVNVATVSNKNESQVEKQDVEYSSKI